MSEPVEEDFLRYADDLNVSTKMNLLGLINGPARDRMHPKLNDSSFFAWCGSRRTGKSMNAIAQAHAIDPEITTENVAFTFEELKELIYSKEHTAIIWDEAAVTSYSRDFMTKVNKDINKFFQVFGYRRLAIIATFQHLGMIDNELRGQLDAVFWCRSKDCKDDNGEPYTKKYLMPFKITKTPFFPPNIKAWDYFQNKKAPNPEKVGWIEVPPLDDLLKMYGVKPNFIKDYQKRKTEFFESLGQDDDSEIQKIDKRWLQTVEKQQNALKAGIEFMSTKLGMSQKEISNALRTPKSTLHTWEFFPEKDRSATAKT